MRSSRRAIVWLLLLLACGCGEGRAPATSERPAPHAEDTHPEEENAIHLGEDMLRDLRISTAQVAAREDAPEITALGELAADQSRYAEVAAPIGAQIVQLLADIDDRIDQAAPLVRFRSPELGRMRADLISAGARRDLARQTLERRRRLADERIVARREVQEAEAASQAADAEYRAAEAALEALGIDAATREGDGPLFTLRSPIAGRIIARDARLGQFVDPGALLFTVADLTRIWMIAQAFERDAVAVRTGTTAHVTLAALPGEQFDGRVVLVGRQVDPSSRTLPVRIELENRRGLLRPGMSATAHIEVAGPGATILTVPAAALQRVGARWMAFVPTGPSEFEMRPVGRGRDLGNAVEVVSGLQAGDTVVVDGAFVLRAEAERRAGGADAHGH